MARFLGLCPVAQFARSAESGQIAELPDLALHQLFVEPICPNNGSDQSGLGIVTRRVGRVDNLQIPCPRGKARPEQRWSELASQLGHWRRWSRRLDDRRAAHRAGPESGGSRSDRRALDALDQAQQDDAGAQRRQRGPVSGEVTSTSDQPLLRCRVRDPVARRAQIDRPAWRTAERCDG